MAQAHRDLLFQDDRIVITREEGGRIVRICRTGVPSTVEWVRDLARRVELILPRIDRPRLLLLFDTRDSPMSNEPALEAAQIAASDRVMEGYKKRAVLVRTAVGKLQASRMNRERGAQISVFDDEAAAIAFLLADQHPSVRPPR